jgi:hypothetical protein
MYDEKNVSCIFKKKWIYLVPSKILHDYKLYKEPKK